MTAEQLQAQLDEMKKGLETAVLTKSKEEVEKLKGEIAEKQKALDSLSEEIKVIKAANVKRDEADKKNQEFIDKLIAQKSDIMNPEPPKRKFADVLKEAIEERTDDIMKMAIKDPGRDKNFSLNLKAVGDITTGNVTGSNWGMVTRPGIIENPKRKVHIRSLVGTGTIGAGTEFVFMRENGDGEGAIAPTAETATKPQIDVDLIEASVKIETIAGWLRVSRKAMNNIPGFISFLQSRLPEKLLKVEDAQLLQGNGTTPNIKGIMTSGNNQASTSTADTLIEQIIDDIALLEDTHEREATGILLRPADYYGFFKHKAAGSGEYDLPQNVSFANGTLYVSGIPVYASTALPAGKRIVGDWEMGAQLLIQEGMRIEFFEQDGTNVRENKITVRIEETVAFPVYGNNYFIVGDNAIDS